MKSSTCKSNRQQNNSSSTSKRIIPSKNSQQLIQLPKIYKNSNNYDTNSQHSQNNQYDLSFEYEKSGNDNRLDQIEQNEFDKEQIGLVDYEKMTLEQIKHEYQRLREQFSLISNEIRKKQQMKKSKILKKTTTLKYVPQFEKKNAQLDKQIYEHSILLTKLRQQYEQIEKRSNLANSSISKPNADLADKIFSCKQKIMGLKEKIKLLRRKTKKTGNDIVNGDNIAELMEKLQKEQSAYLSKLSNLESKLQDSVYKMQKNQNLLHQIQGRYSEAEDYLKFFKLQNDQQSQKNILFNEYKQKQQKQAIIRKKIQSDQQTFLQRYHMLLKGFEFQSDKEKKVDKMLIDADVRILKAQNVIFNLEQQQEELQSVMEQLRQQDKLKMEAQLLRKIAQQETGESTFVTGYGNKPIKLVNSSIIEQNQSQLQEWRQIKKYPEDKKRASSIKKNITQGNINIRNQNSLMRMPQKSLGEQIDRRQMTQKTISTNNNDVSFKNITINDGLIQRQKKIENNPMVAQSKQPYLNYSKNKESIRKRKESAKSNNLPNQVEQSMSDKQILLDQLQEINRKLLEQPINVTDQPQSQNIEKTIDDNSKPSSGNSIIYRVDSKQVIQKRRQQMAKRSLIKAQVLEQIDKNNIEYTQKIENLKRQFASSKQIRKQDLKLYEWMNDTPFRTAAETIDATKESQQVENISQKINEHNKQKEQENKVYIHQKQFQIIHQKQSYTIQKKQQYTIQKKQQQQYSQYNDNQNDSDIVNDISQINKMIKRKLQLGGTTTVN